MARAPETSPADAAERSADRAADAAVRSELPGSTAGAATAPDIGAPPWGAGRPLSLQERTWHEPRAGASLGDVRIHEGAAPARWAGMLGARAFTLGRDVVLGSGEYAPGTQAGQHLMAHELSHVVAGRGRSPVLARVALTPADFDALADSIHGVVGAPTSDEELIYVALQKLERDPTAITSIKSAYKKRFNAELLTDLGTRLKGHGLGLARTLLGEKKGLAVSAAPPGRPAEFQAIARAVNAALAAQTTDPAGVYAALIPLGRAAGLVATLKTTYTKLFTADLEAALTAKLAGADLSYALYLLNAPATASKHSPASVAYTAQPGFGASPTTAAAGGGTVSAGTEVPYSYQPKDPAKPVVSSQFSFGYGYAGALSADTRSLQFIEREIDSTIKGQAKAVPGNVKAQSNSYPLTTDTKQPSWYVDSYDASDPFNETHADTSWRDATSVSVYDAPTPIMKTVKEQFDAGATLVTSRAHFDIYLIRDFAPFFRVEIEIVWTFTAADKHTVNRLVKSKGAVTSLPGPQQKALVARYPAFAYIR